MAGPKRHGLRFIGPLALGLAIPTDRIRIVQTEEDPYGALATQFLPGESRAVAIAKERAALVFHEAAMQGVKPGDLDSLAAAEARFREMAENPAKALMRQPVAVVRAISQAQTTRAKYRHTA